MIKQTYRSVQWRCIEFKHAPILRNEIHCCSTCRSARSVLSLCHVSAGFVKTKGNELHGTRQFWRVLGGILATTVIRVWAVSKCQQLLWSSRLSAISLNLNDWLGFLSWTWVSGIEPRRGEKPTFYLWKGQSVVLFGLTLEKFTMYWTRPLEVFMWKL